MSSEISTRKKRQNLHYKEKSAEILKSYECNNSILTFKNCSEQTKLLFAVLCQQ